MRALRCASCGGLIARTEGGILICQSCGTAQTIERQKEVLFKNSDETPLLWQLAIQSTIHKDYENALHIWERILSVRNETIEQNETETLIRECANAVLAQAFEQFKANMTLKNAEFLIDQYNKVLSICTSAKWNVGAGVIRSSFETFTHDLVEEIVDKIHIRMAKQLTRKQFSYFKEEAVACDAVLFHIIRQDLQNDTIQMTIKTNLLLLEALLSKDEDDLIPNRWGAFNYVPRLTEEETTLFSQKIDFLSEMMEVNKQ